MEILQVPIAHRGPVVPWTSRQVPAHGYGLSKMALQSRPTTYRHFSTNIPTKAPSLSTLLRLKGGVPLILSSMLLSLLLLLVARRQPPLHLLKALRDLATAAPAAVLVRRQGIAREDRQEAVEQTRPDESKLC